MKILAMLVRDAMKGEVLSISPVARLEDALKVFSERNVAYLVVMSGTDVQGILSRNDIIRLSEENRNDISIADKMTKTSVCISASSPLEEAAQLIKESQINALPVCKDETRSLVGIITAEDLTKISDQAILQN